MTATTAIPLAVRTGFARSFGTKICTKKILVLEGKLKNVIIIASDADPDLGSGALLIPGSGIRDG